MEVVASSPLITSIGINDNHILVFQGATAYISVTVRNGMPFQPARLLDAQCLLNLYQPDGTQVLFDEPMTRVSNGRYTYLYQTTPLDPPGLWTIDVMADNAFTFGKLVNVGAFLLRSAPTVTYTVFAMKDQELNIHFLYVDIAGQLVVTPHFPTNIGFKIAELMNGGDISQIPGWMKYNNQHGETRYLYPHVTGDIVIDVSPPLIGPEWVNSPIFTAVNRKEYVLTSNLLDELVVQQLS